MKSPIAGPCSSAGGLAAAAILIWFEKLPCRQSEEEASEERIGHAAAVEAG